MQKPYLRCVKTSLCLMQDCLSNGKPILLENIEEELDPMLDPVLERRYIQQKRGPVILLGDKEVCICGMLQYVLPDRTCEGLLRPTANHRIAQSCYAELLVKL